MRLSTFVIATFLFAGGQVWADAGNMMFVQKIVVAESSHNSGSACLSMALGYIVRQRGTVENISNINKLVGRSDSEKKEMSCDQLVEVSHRMGVLSARKSYLSLGQLKGEVDCSRPVIVAVDAKHLSGRDYGYSGQSFLLVLGVDSSEVFCNDPKSHKNDHSRYRIEDFCRAWEACGNASIAGFEKDFITVFHSSDDYAKDNLKRGYSSVLWTVKFNGIVRAPIRVVWNFDKVYYQPVSNKSEIKFLIERNKVSKGANFIDIDIIQGGGVLPREDFIVETECHCLF